MCTYTYSPIIMVRPLEVKCPWCSRDVGRKCVTYTGKEAFYPHKAREVHARMVWRSQQVQTPDDNENTPRRGDKGRGPEIVERLDERLAQMPLALEYDWDPLQDGKRKSTFDLFEELAHDRGLLRIVA